MRNERVAMAMKLVVSVFSATLFLDSRCYVNAILDTANPDKPDDDAKGSVGVASLFSTVPTEAGYYYHNDTSTTDRSYTLSSEPMELSSEPTALQDETSTVVPGNVSNTTANVCAGPIRTVFENDTAVELSWDECEPLVNKVTIEPTFNNIIDINATSRRIVLGMQNWTAKIYCVSLHINDSEVATKTLYNNNRSSDGLVSSAVIQNTSIELKWDVQIKLHSGIDVGAIVDEYSVEICDPSRSNWCHWANHTCNMTAQTYGNAWHGEITCRHLCSAECGKLAQLPGYCTYRVSSLMPYTYYNITVFAGLAINSTKMSPTWSHILQTKEGVPGPASNLKVISLSGDADHPDKRVILEWSKAAPANGNVSYGVSIQPMPGIMSPVINTMGKSMPFEVVFDWYYLITVVACTQVGCAEDATLPYILKPGKPLAKESIEKPAEETSDSTIAFNMLNMSDIFDFKEGKIERFEIAVIAGDRSSNEELKSWKDSLDSHVPYGPWSSCSKLTKPVHNHRIVIGNGCSCEVSETEKMHCNEKLRHSTQYCVYVIGYTSSEKGANSSCIVVTRTKDFVAPPKEVDNMTIALAIVFVLLLIAILVSIALLMLRRRRVLRFRLPWERAGNNDRSATELTQRKVTSRPVLRTEFASYVSKMHENSNLGFSKEFHDIKFTAPKHSFSAAVCMSNVPKNRYADIMPFDHSRVHLVTDDEDEYDGSDYINANYIPGFNSPREYVAAQGPLPATVDDFWRMVWEQNVPTIVMLTSVVERGNTKCEQYWPDGLGQKTVSHANSSSDPSKCYGDILVTRLSVTNFESYDLTELQMSQKSISKRVNHFFYRLWPDMSCPHDKDVFIGFVEQVRKSHGYGCGDESRRRAGKLTGPMVVHCSAGVGRTGTFIAIDVLLQHIAIHPYIDVLGAVLKLRDHRCRMVQTEDQYVFIHDCISDAITDTLLPTTVDCDNQFARGGNSNSDKAHNTILVTGLAQGDGQHVGDSSELCTPGGSPVARTDATHKPKPSPVARAGAIKDANRNGLGTTVDSQQHSHSGHADDCSGHARRASAAYDETLASNGAFSTCHVDDGESTPPEECPLLPMSHLLTGGRQ